MRFHDDPKRTKPEGLARYAREFFEAALAVDDKIGQSRNHDVMPSIPVLYMTGHSIELALKAFLVYKGIPLHDLPKKKYGHNLIKCFKKANELGLKNIVTFESTEVGAIRLLNELYSTKQLNYIVTGAKSFPVYGFVQSFAKKLLDGVCPYVGYK